MSDSSYPGKGQGFHRHFNLLDEAEQQAATLPFSLTRVAQKLECVQSAMCTTRTR